MHGQHNQQSMDQPGMVANPARSQLKKETSIFHLSSPFALENLVSRERFSRPVPGQPTNFPHSEDWIWCFLVGFLPISAKAFIDTFNRHRVSPNFFGSRNCDRWLSLPSVHLHRASIPQGSSSNGCCLFRFHHGPILVVPLFSHAHCWYSADPLIRNTIWG